MRVKWNIRYKFFEEWKVLTACWIISSNMSMVVIVIVLMVKTKNASYKIFVSIKLHDTS